VWLQFVHCLLTSEHASLKLRELQPNPVLIYQFTTADLLVVMIADISGGPCKEFSYVLGHFLLHWGEEDSAGSEHLINSTAYPAEVSRIACVNADAFASFVRH